MCYMLRVLVLNKLHPRTILICFQMFLTNLPTYLVLTWTHKEKVVDVLVVNKLRRLS